MSLFDLLTVPLPGKSPLLVLLNEPLPDQEIELENGQIWENDYNNLKCKILGFNKESVQILLDVNFNRTRGKTGSKKYDDLWLNYFLDNYSLIG